MTNKDSLDNKVIGVDSLYCVGENPATESALALSLPDSSDAVRPTVETDNLFRRTPVPQYPPEGFSDGSGFNLPIAEPQEQKNR